MRGHSGTARALSSASFCPIPADHVPLVVLLSPCPLLCVHIGANHSCFSSTVCCPAVRIHNHTVLPSSHNSSSVYTNDSAYTNISATVGEHPVPPRLLLSPSSRQFEPPPEASDRGTGTARCVCDNLALVTFSVIIAYLCQFYILRALMV